MVRIVAGAMSSVFVLSMLVLPQQAIAAPLSSGAGATHRSVGSRIDTPLAPAKSKAASRGAYTSPPATHTTSVALTVTSGPVDDFSIAATPSSQGVLQGSSTSYAVTTQVTSGSAQTVALSLGGLPAGASGTFTPGSVSAG